MDSLFHMGLITGISNGLLEAVQSLIRNGVDADWINEKEHEQYQETALIIACYMENLEMVRLLLESGADPNIVCGRYRTALNASVCVGNAEIAKLLLDYGADPSISPHPLLNSLDDNPEIASLFLKYGNIDLRKDGWNQAIQMATEYNQIDLCQELIFRGADVDKAIVSGSGTDHIEIVKLLLLHGADPSINDELQSQQPLLEEVLK